MRLCRTLTKNPKECLQRSQKKILKYTRKWLSWRARRAWTKRLMMKLKLAETEDTAEEKKVIEEGMVKSVSPESSV